MNAPTCPQYPTHSQKLPYITDHRPFVSPAATGPPIDLIRVISSDREDCDGAAGSGATVVTRATAAAGHRTGQEGAAGGGRRGVAPPPPPYPFGRLILRVH